jgi:hypothetical protein
MNGFQEIVKIVVFFPFNKEEEDTVYFSADHYIHGRLL